MTDSAVARARPALGAQVLPLVNGPVHPFGARNMTSRSIGGRGSAHIRPVTVNFRESPDKCGLRRRHSVRFSLLTHSRAGLATESSEIEIDRPDVPVPGYEPARSSMIDRSRLEDAVNALPQAHTLGHRVGRAALIVVSILALLVGMPLVSAVSASAGVPGSGVDQSIGPASTGSTSLLPVYVWALLGMAAVLVGLVVAGRHSSVDQGVGDLGMPAPAGSVV